MIVLFLNSVGPICYFRWKSVPKDQMSMASCDIKFILYDFKNCKHLRNTYHQWPRSALPPSRMWPVDGRNTFPYRRSTLMSGSNMSYQSRGSYSEHSPVINMTRLCDGPNVVLFIYYMVWYEQYLTKTVTTMMHEQIAQAFTREYLSVKYQAWSIAYGKMVGYICAISTRQLTVSKRNFQNYPLFIKFSFEAHTLLIAYQLLPVSGVQPPRAPSGSSQYSPNRQTHTDDHFPGTFSLYCNIQMSTIVAVHLG